MIVKHVGHYVSRGYLGHGSIAEAFGRRSYRIRLASAFDRG